jgi:uncharacterized protein (DUF488 family)
MPRRFYTIGHSTRTIPEFVDLLREAGAEIVVDVRTVPRSRTNPQFNREALPESLAKYQIKYEHVAELGGLRGRHRDGPSPNAFCGNESFRNYADYALTDGFRTGLARLTAIGSTCIPAIMCAEAVWWRCHRRIIADYLLTLDNTVLHILGPGKIQQAKLTDGACLTDAGVIYGPAPTSEKGGSAAINRRMDNDESGDSE